MLCERGAVDAEIAEFFDISPSTFYRWRNEHPTFADALVMGKEYADVRVERALYNRAVGYSYESEKLITVSVGNNMGSAVERHKIIEHVPPSEKAAIRWLESRKPKEWRRTVGITGGDGGPLAISNAEDQDFSKLTPDERTNLRSLLAKAAESGSDEG
jgi:hypothetical protein